MRFEELFIRINEILHASIQRYKEGIIGSGSYSDLTLSQLFYIEAIHSLGNPSLGELAARLKVSSASASVGVRKLLQKGMIVKVRSSEDRRVYHIGLSRLGKKLMEAEARAFSDFIANIRRALSDSEIDAVERIFRKILDRYQ
ncbi:MAG: MarR family transcriptional regulator [Spirochaetes bacterium]|nr:MarR family transcriptional regulator [Spirochaetota bacterium]